MPKRTAAPDKLMRRYQKTKVTKTKKERMHTFSNRSKSGSKTTDLLGKSKQANISKEWRGSN